MQDPMTQAAIGSSWPRKHSTPSKETILCDPAILYIFSPDPIFFPPHPSTGPSPTQPQSPQLRLLILVQDSLPKQFSLPAPNSIPFCPSPASPSHTLILISSPWLSDLVHHPPQTPLPVSGSLHPPCPGALSHFTHPSSPRFPRASICTVFPPSPLAPPFPFRLLPPQLPTSPNLSSFPFTVPLLCPNALTKPLSSSNGLCTHIS